MKTLSTALLCLVLLFAGVRVGSAQVLSYSFSQQLTTVQGGSVQSYRLLGELLWDLATTNVAVVLWPATGKTFFVQPATNYVVVPLNGGSQRGQLTALEFSPLAPVSGTQYLGAPPMGKNTRLKIGTNQFVELPSVFTSENTTVAYNPQDGSSNSLTKLSRRYVFSAATTQSVNNHGQSLDQALNALVQSLISKGYSQGPTGP